MRFIDFFEFFLQGDKSSKQIIAEKRQKPPQHQEEAVPEPDVNECIADDFGFGFGECDEFFE